MAGRFSVEAVFKAVDRVTAPVTRMQNRIGKMTRALENGFRNANRTVGRVSASLGRGLQRGAMAATVAVAGLAFAINSVSGSADALAKQSRRLQFPIGELQEWKFVAEQSGISNELLDNSLGAFSKRLGEAKAGVGPLVSGLKKLNPELLAQLNATDSVSDAFELYMGAIREAESATEKAALANAAFSRSGLNLVNIADNSAEAIDALQKQQRANGVITMEQAVAAEAYGDAVNALEKTVGGFIQSVLLPMLPMLTEIVLSFREWALANKDIVAGKIFEFGKNLVSNFQDIIKWVKRIGIALAVFFAFAAVLKTLVLIMTAVNLVMAANPISLIIIGVFLLISAISAMIFWWDEIKTTMIEFATTAVSGVINAISWLRDSFASLPGPVQAAIVLISGPIGWLIASSAMIMESWSPLKEFFADLWAGIVSVFDTAINKITGVINWLATSSILVMESWSPLKEFFADLWSGVIDIFNSSIDKIMSVVDKVKGAASFISGAVSSAGSGVANFFGFGNNEEQNAKEKTSPQIVSPQERVARSIEEQRSTSTAEVTIRDESGRAEVTGGSLGPGLSLQSSGGF